MLVVLILLSVPFVLAQKNVTWQAFDSMYSGIIQPITNSAVSLGTVNNTASPAITYKYSINFVGKTFTSATLVNIGIISMQIKPLIGTTYCLINSHENRTTTGFIYYLTVNTTNNINKLKVNYFCADGDSFSALTLSRSSTNLSSDLTSTDSGSGYRYGSLTATMTKAVNLSHTLIQITHIKGFKILATSTDKILTLGVLRDITSSTDAKITIWTSGYCQLFDMEYYSLLIDKDQVEVTQQYFMDYGNIIGSKNSQLTQINFLELVSSGYIFTTNYFHFNLSSGANQGFDLDPTTKSLTAQQDYSYVNLSYFSFKKRGCPTTDPNYYNPEELCYETCPTKTFLNATYKFCTDCKFDCSTCTNVSACSSCNTTESHRVQNGTKCQCIDGYFQSNQYACSVCQDGCVKCSNNSACTTCNTTAGYSKSNSTCVCNSTSFSSNSTCSNCSSVLLGCSACANSSSCSSCLNSNYTHNSSSSVCKCSTGYIQVELVCLSCADDIPGCLECSSTTQCTKCGDSFNLNEGVCECPDGTYLDGEAVECKKCDMTCQTCSGGTTSECATCPSFLNFQSGFCNCPNQGYVSNGTACIECASLCSSSSCTNSSSSPCRSCGCPCQNGYYLDETTLECSSCDISDLASSDQSCTCPLGMYPNSTNSNNSCLVCHYSCSTCSDGTNTSCTLCNSADYRTLKNYVCECNLFYMDAKNNTSLCVPLVCDAGYSITTEGLCSPVCGDGLVAPEQQCDDKNSLNSDGCDSNCKVELNWVCEGSLTSASVCYYNKPLQMQLVSIIKNPSSNNLTYTINIHPNISNLENLNFSQIINLGLPNDTKLQYKYENGVLKIEAQYFQNIPANITFSPSNSSTSSAFSKTPDSELSYTVQPTNNLSADVFSEEQYSQAEMLKYLVFAVVGLAILTYCFGLYGGKLIGTEMIWVVQLAFIGLIILDYTDPLYEPMRNLMFVNGYSIQFTNTQTKMPNRIQSLGYYNSLINNLNLMVIIVVLLGVVSLSFFLASKFLKADDKKMKMLSYAKLTIGEFMITAILLLLYQYLVSTCILVQYPFEEGMILYASLAEAGVFALCAIAITILYALKSKVFFGQYKTFFKDTKIGKYYYLVPIICRIGIGIFLGMFHGNSMTGFVVLGLLGVELVLTLALRPYLKSKHTVREATNILVGVIVIACYAIFGKMKLMSHSISRYVPIGIVILLLVTVILNLIFLILEVIENCKANKKVQQQSEKKHQQQQLKQDQQNQLKFFQQESKKMKAEQKAKKSKKIVSVFKSKSLTPQTLNTQLLNSESTPKTKMEQFENSLYPMDENEVNLEDIQLSPIGFTRNMNNQDQISGLVLQKIEQNLDDSKQYLNTSQMVMNEGGYQNAQSA